MNDYVTKNQADELHRLATCAACDEAQPRKRGRLTVLSGCRLGRWNLYSISRQARAVCPLGKWGAVEGIEVERKTTPLTDVQREEAQMVAIIARAARGEAEGAGDLLAAYFDKIGVEAAAKFYRRMMGKTCGCANSVAWLNRQAWLTSFARSIGLL
jgi:hypothetical protein